MAGRTNETSMSYVEEASSGVLPGSPEWKYVEPNDISTYGATITTMARNPISNSRGAKKGSVVDLDSSVEFTGDMTLDAFTDFSKGFTFANWTTQLNFEPTAVTTSAYTVPAYVGALTAGDLVFARNFLNSDNDGLKVVDAGSTTTSIVVTDTLIAETSIPTTAEVDVVGVQGASGDIEINASGNLTSAVLDFTTLGLSVGQFIYIGGGTTDTDFGTSPGGYARCRAIADHLITLDKAQNTLVTDVGTGKTIQLFFGSFLRDRPTDDADFVTQTYQFETRIPNLTEGTSYEYAKGNICNSVGFNLAVASKAEMTLSFIGTDTDTPVIVRKTGTWKSPSLTSAMSTTADVAKLRLSKIDETGLTTHTKSLDITINNNATAEKVVGTLGAIEIGYGDFAVTGSTEVLFESATVIEAIRDNETVTLDWAMENTDGALYFDLPSMTLGSGNKSFPENEIIKLAIEGNAFEDTFFGYTIGVTKFPYIPGQ